MDRPKPPMLSFGKILEGLFAGIGGGRPASESESNSEPEDSYLVAIFF